MFSHNIVFLSLVMEWKSYLPLTILAVEIVLLWIFFILAVSRNKDVSLIQLGREGGKVVVVVVHVEL